MAPLKLPAFLQRCLKIRIQSREHLGFRPRPHHNHVLRARIPLFVNVDAEPNFLPRWLINHEITPSRALRQKHRLQQLDRRDCFFRLLAGDFFPSLDGAVHIDDRLKDVSFLPPCSEKLFDMVQVLDVLLPMLHVLLDARLPLLRLDRTTLIVVNIVENELWAFWFKVSIGVKTSPFKPTRSLGTASTPGGIGKR